MTEFEKTYQNYNPRQAALDEARALLTACLLYTSDAADE